VSNGDSQRGPRVSCMRLSLIDPHLSKDPPQGNEAKTWDNAAIPPWRRRRDLAYWGRRRLLEKGISRQAAVLTIRACLCAETDMSRLRGLIPSRRSLLSSKDAVRALIPHAGSLRHRVLIAESDRDTSASSSLRHHGRSVTPLVAGRDCHSRRPPPILTANHPALHASLRQRLQPCASP
jgi:hypothetical protein